MMHGQKNIKRHLLSYSAECNSECSVTEASEYLHRMNGHNFTCTFALLLMSVRYSWAVLLLALIDPKKKALITSETPGTPYPTSPLREPQIVQDIESSVSIKYGQFLDCPTIC